MTCTGNSVLNINIDTGELIVIMMIKIKKIIMCFFGIHDYTDFEYERTESLGDIEKRTCNECGHEDFRWKSEFNNDHQFNSEEDFRNCCRSAMNMSSMKGYFEDTSETFEFPLMHTPKAIKKDGKLYVHRIENGYSPVEFYDMDAGRLYNREGKEIEQ